MRIRTTRNVMIDGAAHVAGSIIDVPDKTARFLIVIGKAVLAEESPPETVASREEDLGNLMDSREKGESFEEENRRRRRRKKEDDDV